MQTIEYHIARLINAKFSILFHLPPARYLRNGSTEIECHDFRWHVSSDMDQVGTAQRLQSEKRAKYPQRELVAFSGIIYSALAYFNP